MARKTTVDAGDSIDRTTCCIISIPASGRGWTTLPFSYMVECTGDRKGLGELGESVYGENADIKLLFGDGNNGDFSAIIMIKKGTTNAVGQFACVDGSYIPTSVRSVWVRVGHPSSTSVEKAKKPELEHHRTIPL